MYSPILNYSDLGGGNCCIRKTDYKGLHNFVFGSCSPHLFRKVLIISNWEYVKVFVEISSWEGQAAVVWQKNISLVSFGYYCCIMKKGKSVVYLWKESRNKALTCNLPCFRRQVAPQTFPGRFLKVCYSNNRYRVALILEQQFSRQYRRCNK